MDFTQTHIRSINEFSDSTIIIKDSNKTITLNVHKIILAYHCEYFYKMFTFGKLNNQYKMIVDNADIMHAIIMEFYGFKNNFPENYRSKNLPISFFRRKIDRKIF